MKGGHREKSEEETVSSGRNYYKLSLEERKTSVLKLIHHRGI
jgi:hypothetical protein